jgi:hypothetical protein
MSTTIVRSLLVLALAVVVFGGLYILVQSLGN